MKTRGREAEIDLLTPREELARQYEKAKLRLAYYDAQVKRADAIIDDYERLPEDQLDALGNISKGARGRVLKGAYLSIRKQKAHRVYKTVLLPAARVTALIAVIFSLGVTSVVAGSSTLRKAVYGLIFTQHETHTSVSFVADQNNYFDVPADWQGKYYPSFIPDGYELETVSDILSVSFRAIYKNPSGEYLHFIERTEDVKTNIDTENAAISFVTIRGYQGMMAVKDRKIMIAWSADERFFVLRLIGEESTAKQIAESLRMVN